MLVKVTVAIAVMTSCWLAVPAASATLPSPASTAKARCTITGTPGNDVLRGTRGRDVICGLGGNDRILGGGGNDLLIGGPGNDVLRGEAGNDTLVGGPGNDTLNGGPGRDVLKAKDGAAYRDRVSCGRGRDRAFADARDRVQRGCETLKQPHAPTAITLTPASVAENRPAGTEVGRLTAADRSAGDTHTFTLVPSGASGDGSFRIVGRSLVTIRGLDHEATPTLAVRVRVTDSTRLTFERLLTITVTDVDEPATAVDDAATVLEDSAPTAIDVLANDTDVDGGALAIATATQPDAGTVVVTGGGTGLTYAPDADTCTGSGPPDLFTYTLAGGGTASVAVTVTCVPDAPVLETTPGTTAYVEDDPATAVDPGLGLTDVDADGTITGATVAISGGFASGQDVLALAGTHPGITAGYADGTLTLSGAASAAAYRAALRDVTYANTSQAPSTAARTVTFEVTDDAALTDTATRQLSVTAVNDAPVNAVPGAQDAAEGETLAFGADDANAISVSDVDAGDEDVQVTLTATHGTLTLGGTAGLEFETGDGADDTTMTITGSLVAVNAALDGTTYSPDANYAGSAALEITTDDLGHTGDGGAKTDTDTVAIDVRPRNQAPENSVPHAQEVDEDADLVFSADDDNAISIADPDAGDEPVVTSISVTHGAVLLFRTTGLSFLDGTADGHGTIRVRGTIADINAALDGLTYAPDPDYYGDALLEIDTSDQGNTGVGGELSDYDTVDIAVLPVNDAPTASAPETALVAEDGTLVLSTEDGTALRVGDVDAGAGEVTAEVTVTHGTVTLGGTADVEVSGDGTAHVTLTGTVVAVNEALADTSYVPADDYSGPAELTLAVDDQGHFGAGGAKTASADTAITIVGENDPPVITVPTGATLDQGSSHTFGGGSISVLDVDAGAGEVEVTLEVGHGTLTLASTADVTVTTGSGSEDATVVFAGPVADVNAALDGLVYRPHSDFHGADRLDITVDDLGNTGAGGARTASASVALTVVRANSAPVNTVPGDQTLAEDTTMTLADTDRLAVSDADVDDATGELEVDLAVDHGRLTLDGTDGLTFSAGDGTADAHLTFRGTPDAINAALDGLGYRPDLDYHGSDTLTIVTDDLGETGPPGALTDTDTVALTVTAVNDAPVLTVPESVTAAEDTEQAVDGLSVADVDADGGDLEVSLAVEHGTLTLGTSAGLAFASGDGADDAQIVVEGTLDDLNAALGTLSYTGDADYHGADTVAIEVSDLGHTGAGGPQTDDAQVPVTVTAVNDAPSITLPGAQAVDEDTTLTLGEDTAISVADVDATALQVTLAPTHGTVTLATTDGLEFDEGDGTGDPVVTFTGTQAAVNHALDGLTYTPTANYGGAAEIRVSTTDEGGLSAIDELSITVTPVNDAPVATTPSTLQTLEDTTAPVDGLGIADLDAGADDLEVSLAVDHGTLSLATTMGLTFTTGNGLQDATIVARGSLDELNAALATLHYLGDADYFGEDTLVVEVDDLGHTGAGGAQTDTGTVDVTVDPVNDAPSFVKGPDQDRVDNKDDDSGDPLAHTIDPWATEISAGPGEGDQTLSFEVTTDDEDLFDVLPDVSPEGVLTFTPNPSEVGTATVTVRLTDDGGTADGGADASAEQTFVIETVEPGPVISSVTPSPLVPGATAILSGRKFSTTPAQNIVTIGGASATVTGATATTLTVTVPCVSSGAGVAVQATVNGVDTNTFSHPLQVTQRDLEVGEATIITNASEVGCNELASADGPARYVVAAYNAGTSPTSSSGIQLSGDGTAEESATLSADRGPLPLDGPGEHALADHVHGESGIDELESPEDGDAHLELLEQNREQYEVLREEFGTEGVQHRGVQLDTTAEDMPAIRTFRVSNINQAPICNRYYVSSATRVYAEGKLVIYEDDATPAPLKAANNPSMADYYERIGDQFNADMEPIIRDNFGDILRRDSVTDNNGVMVALSTPRLNNDFPGVAGFVVSCDQFPNDDANTPPVGGPYTGSGVNGASNFGEFFYLYQPTSTASGYSSGNTPDNWYRTIRSTFIHETKHVASMAARVANDAPAYEAAWLEEGTARHAEELWARESVYDLPWKGNSGYGSAGAPYNIYCDVRPSGWSECDANPRGPVSIMQRHFTSLYTHQFGQNARLLSPFGTTPSDNSSYFYAISWSLVRYAIDRFGTSDADFLTALTQSTTSGVTNLSDRTGVSTERLLGGWALALAVDDYPGLSNASADVQMPTWDFRSIYAGLNQDFPGTYSLAYPNQPPNFAFGSFAPVNVTTMYGGGVLWYQISGTQTQPQLLRLRGNGGVALGGTIRLAVVRVQ